eukprot:scaffold2107_cov127-Isochrysis_galbana.AAC.9
MWPTTLVCHGPRWEQLSFSRTCEASGNPPQAHMQALKLCSVQLAGGWRMDRSKENKYKAA